ncbi:hypothetical protein [Modestobacter sp. NPDC049651]|uniref:hypothetical protein n=1 Tax=unclassified Modestobacter TaxID=2643866 RepID=UPI0033FF65D9
MTDLRIQRGAGQDEGADGLPRPRGAPVVDPPQIPSPPPGQESVELARLLRLAGLSSGQAVEVAAQLLAAAEAGGSPVGVTPAGMVVGGTPDVGAVLADVVRAARLRAGTDGDPLLDRLDAAVAGLPGAGVARTAQTLAGLADGLDRAVVRAELGALARAVAARTGPVPGAGPAATRTGPVRRAAPPATAPGGSRNTRRRAGAWLLSLLVLVGAVLLERALLGDKVADDIDVLLDAGRSGATPSADPEPDGRPVALPAPTAAGAVRGVDVRPLTGCTPGQPCTVRVLVRVVPGAEPQAVTWSWHLVDRCTGAVVTAPGGTASVPPGQERAAVVATVALPAAPAVAVVAVTEQPAVAASAPLPLGSCRNPTG